MARQLGDVVIMSSILIPDSVYVDKTINLAAVKKEIGFISLYVGSRKEIVYLRKINIVRKYSVD